MAYSSQFLDEAKRKCRLWEEEIRMAKEMRLNPKSLIKNIPSKSEQWKTPVKEWIHAMYDKRHINFVMCLLQLDCGVACLSPKEKEKAKIKMPISRRSIFYV